jgi:predicted enzyme related to lactoylglutathione lyase
MAGEWVWYDLMTSDVGAAAEFYGSVMRWRLDTKDAAYGEWIAADGVHLGGAMGLPMPGMPPMWSAYVEVSGIEGVAEKLKAAGGHVMRPVGEAGGAGKFAVVSDPDGAMFMLFEGTGAIRGRPAPFGAVGHGTWHELQTNDVDRAWEFYRELFGWEPAGSMDIGPAGEYRMYAAPSGGAQMGGMMRRASPEVPPHWLTYFQTDAIEGAVERATAHGGTVVMGPMPIPGGKAAVLRDGQGAYFGLCSSEV